MLASKKISLETFLKPNLIPVFNVSRDESFLLFSSNSSGAFNLWKMDLDKERTQTQLTSHNQKIESISIANDGTIYFTSDKDGNENMHIYSIDDNGGKWKGIRTESNCRYFFGGLSEDNSKLYYTTSKDNPVYLSIYSYELETENEVLLHHGSGAETYLLDVSPNGEDIAYFVRYNHSNMKIYVKRNGQDMELIPFADQHYRVSDLCFMNEDKVLF
ncbi:MAG TPA: DPP IV N-terminal domain-containing protein, partial [Pseudoneobacillus sp.]|nr:DPP IV N-terminal domain-containing protein [Pseudoneobacillus sp.]